MPDSPPTDSTDEQRSKLDATGEFFSVGTPLHAVRAGYVRRRADDVLYENVIAGRFAHVIAPDRSGKSSLVAATAARLEANGVKVAVLDLEQIGERDAGSDSGRWYYSVAYRLLRQLRIRVDLQTWWQDKSILSNRQRLLEFYSEIVLQNVRDDIVVFVDEIQCIENVDFADQLLASIRSAHNARTTDPEYARLTFVLLGECDPVSLVGEPEHSPFNVTQPVALEDFTRAELDLFAAELNLGPAAAADALDRIYYWTSGQPYLSQKLARAVARETDSQTPTDTDNLHEVVDSIVAQQFGGRSALHSEPHMSHIHRRIVSSRRNRDALLNLFGKLRKGVEVATDLGSPLQRRLIAVGLIVVDNDGNLQLRNRLVARVFTARWANDNLTTRWTTPLAVAGVLLVTLALPFWYTQWLPNGYVDALTSDSVALETARQSYLNFRSFPGHRDTADQLYRTFIERRAQRSRDAAEVAAVAGLAAELAEPGNLGNTVLAEFWDRQARRAVAGENRDTALLATLESLLVSTPERRQQAAMLAGEDYPSLLASMRYKDQAEIVFDPLRLTLTEQLGGRLTQQTFIDGRIEQRQGWMPTALEVQPLVRRVVVDQPGIVSRVGLTLNISHARVSDLRIKVIAPSGRTVEVTTGVERAVATDVLRIPAAQLGGLAGESLQGTWSISVRDEELGVAGQLVGWNLTLNSQGLVEEFQRGINIADPIERESEDIWLSPEGRYAIARAQQSDSARIWDLALAQPVRAIPVSELEELIGLAAAARLLVTVAQDSVNVWDTVSGERIRSLPVAGAAGRSQLTRDGMHLVIARAVEADTRFELWSVEAGERLASLQVAGVPSLMALNASGETIATADYDQTVRVWDTASGLLLQQIPLDSQPSSIQLSATGNTVGVVSGTGGVSLWSVDGPQAQLLEERGEGNWQLRFSPSGRFAAVGRTGLGFQVYDVATARPVGPALATGYADPGELLAFSADEQILLTGGSRSQLRFWRAPQAGGAEPGRQTLVATSFTTAAATPDGRRIVAGDIQGNVRILPTGAGTAAPDQLSFLGHRESVTGLALSADSEWAASVATDNSLRLWNVETGVPAPWFIELDGSAVRQLAFSPTGTQLAVLQDDVLQLYSTLDGERQTRVALDQPFPALVFVDETRIILGSDAGVVTLLTQSAEGLWTMQPLWQTDAAIRHLAATANGRRLIIVDARNQARQFDLNSGEVGELAVQLPGAIRSLAIAPLGNRVVLRTDRWLHRVNLSVSGLVWRDAVLAPRTPNSWQFVFAADDVGDHRLLLPRASGAEARVQTVGFEIEDNPGLIGSRADLLQGWRLRLGLSAGVAGSDSSNPADSTQSRGEPQPGDTVVTSVPN